MPIVRATQTRPNIDVQFYQYSSEYVATLSARHNFYSHMTMTQDGLTKIVEMTFDTTEDFDAWNNDLERKAMSGLVNEYNLQYGITTTYSLIP